VQSFQELLRFIGRLGSLNKRTLECSANTNFKLDQAKPPWWWFRPSMSQWPIGLAMAAGASLALSIMVL